MSTTSVDVAGLDLLTSTTATVACSVGPQWATTAYCPIARFERGTGAAKSPAASAVAVPTSRPARSTVTAEPGAHP